MTGRDMMRLSRNRVAFWVVMPAVCLLALALLWKATDDERPGVMLGQEWAPSQHGYGAVEPSRIHNGGDPTGAVWDITWTTWGSDRAVGNGTGYFARNGPVDSSEAAAVVVAFQLGTCDGKPAYRAIEWYFPAYGGTFDPDEYIDICSGEYVGP